MPLSETAQKYAQAIYKTKAEKLSEEYESSVELARRASAIIPIRPTCRRRTQSNFPSYQFRSHVLSSSAIFGAATLTGAAEKRRFVSCSDTKCQFHGWTTGFLWFASILR